MLPESRLFPYQRRIVQHLLDHPNCMVWADMGLGKTVTALTAYRRLRDNFDVTGALVIAPKRIIQTVWRQEAKKWEHTKDLVFSLINGPESARVVALRKRADIYLINPENLSWLVTQIQHHYLGRKRYPPFSLVIYDEITRMKNARQPEVRGGSKRGKAWVRMLPYFNRRVGLTGEPAANGYRDLFGQYLVVDGGARLGTSIQAYRDAFLRPFGFHGTNWVATNTGKEAIHQRIQDITLEMSAEEYLDLPPLMTNDIWVDLPPRAREIYDRLENEFFAELDSGHPLEVLNEAAKVNKLLQIASGAAYLTTGGPWEEIHRAKLEALESALEEASGRPMLLGYTFRHEESRIAAQLPERPQLHEGATFLASRLGERAIADIIRRWEHDEIPLLCGHPASMGHGLNLQNNSARSVIWFSLPWSLELYNQMNARLFGGHRRQGASVIHRILARNTMDEVVHEALQGKAETQAGLRQAINAYRQRRQ